MIVDLKFNSIKDQPQPTNALASIGRKNTTECLFVALDGFFQAISHAFDLLQKVLLLSLLHDRTSFCIVYLVSGFL